MTSLKRTKTSQNDMPNILTGQIKGATTLSISVGTLSTQLIGASSGQQTFRAGMIITNLSTGTVYIAFGGNAAALNAGIPLLPGGGAWSMDEYTYSQEAVNAIAHSASSQVAAQEFYI